MGRDCTWRDWSVKCVECARNKQGRCSFEESPEERMDNAEACHSWGLDSLTGKSFHPPQYFSLSWLT